MTRHDAHSADDEPDEERSTPAEGTGWLPRRRLLTYIGGVSVAGLAGCNAPSGSDDPESGSDTVTVNAEDAGSEATDDDSAGGGDGTDGSAEGDGTSTGSTGGDGSDGTVGDGDESSGAAVADSVENYQFSPEVVRVDPGDAVTWEISEGTHTVTTYHPDNGKSLRIPTDTSSFDSGLLQTGESFTNAFETEGVYDYYCTPHEGMGMVGAVVVGSPDPNGGEPGLSRPADDVAAPDAVADLTAAVVEELGGTSETGSGSDGDGTDGTNDGEDTGDGSGDGDTTDGGTGDGDADSVAVTVPGRRFSPDLVEVAIGGSVEWTFEEGGHTVTAYESRIPPTAATFDSGLGTDGERYTHTFETEGVYDYYCMPHKDKGMTGSVIVGDPDPEGDEPGLSDPTQGDEEGSALGSLNARAVELLSGGTNGGGEDDSGEESYDVIDATTLEDPDGTVDIDVETDGGGVRAGGEAPITVRFQGARFANAPVEVDGDVQGETDDAGEYVVQVPGDLETDDELRIEVRVDGARGRVEVPVVA